MKLGEILKITMPFDRINVAYDFSVKPLYEGWTKYIPQDLMGYKVALVSVGQTYDPINKVEVPTIFFSVYEEV